MFSSWRLFGSVFLTLLVNISSENELFPIAENTFKHELSAIKAHLQHIRNTRILDYKDVKDLKISFQLINSDQLSEYIYLNGETGEFRINRPLDREELCKEKMDKTKKTTFASLVDTDCIKKVDILMKYLHPDDTLVSDKEPETISIRLAVLDVNDNTPRWNDQSIVLKFSESTSDDFMSQKKSFPCAVDPDYSKNGTVNYKLTGNGSQLFRLTVNCSNAYDYAKEEILSEIISISPKVPLDREDEAFLGNRVYFNLTVIATDNGVHSLSSSLNLDIMIIDINDNAPEFNFGSSMNADVTYSPLENTYQVILPETTAVRTQILRLMAKDKDSGINGMVTYDFCPCEHSVAKEYFKIDQTTGVMTVARAFDFDRGIKSFEFKVIASDKAMEPYTLTSTATVSVTIKDVNDEKPEIKVSIIDSQQRAGAKNGQTNSITAFLKENTSNMKLFAIIQVVDEDANDEVTCRLRPRDSFTLVREPSSKDSAKSNDAIEYKLFVGKSPDQMIDNNKSNGSLLDRELSQKQNVSIICQDSAGNTASFDIDINLIDVNDNEPKFTKNLYSFEINENTSSYSNKRGVEVGKVSAQDLDSGENGLVTYAILGESMGFDIDPNSGQLFLYTELDRETGPSDGKYSLNIMAKDKGSPESLSSTCSVEIKVLDLNDMPPDFTQDNYLFEIAEDSKRGTIVGRVHAYDRDMEGKNDSIRYRFARNEDPRMSFETLRENMPHKYFLLDEKTGEISVVGTLDRESISTFLFNVIAIDAPLQKHDKHLTSTTRVTISITDVNDNTPKFNEPDGNRVVKLPINTLPGKFLLKFSANDLDEGLNGRILYKIKPEIITSVNSPSDSLQELFSVDENSGSLILMNSFQKPATYRIIVEACDDGQPRRCANSPPVEVVFLSEERFAKIDQGYYNDPFGRNRLSQSYSNQPGNDELSSGSRRNFTIALCLCIIFITIVIAVALIIFVFKKTSSTRQVFPGFAYAERHDRGCWQFIFSRKAQTDKTGVNNPSVYDQKYTIARGVTQAKDNMHISNHEVYTRYPMGFNEQTIQKRSYTSQAYTNGSPLYQSLDRLDACSGDYQRPQSSVPVNPLQRNALLQQMNKNHTSQFYNPSDVMFKDKIGQLSYYAIANQNMPHKVETITRTVSTKTTDSFNDKPKSLNAEEAADAEIIEYTSRIDREVATSKTIQKHQIRAYTEGSFV